MQRTNSAAARKCLLARLTRPRDRGTALLAWARVLDTLDTALTQLQNLPPDAATDAGVRETVGLINAAWCAFADARLAGIREAERKPVARTG